MTTAKEKSWYGHDQGTGAGWQFSLYVHTSWRHWDSFIHRHLKEEKEEQMRDVPMLQFYMLWPWDITRRAKYPFENETNSRTCRLITGLPTWMNVHLGSHREGCPLQGSCSVPSQQQGSGGGSIWGLSEGNSGSYPRAQSRNCGIGQKHVCLANFPGKARWSSKKQDPSVC